MPDIIAESKNKVTIIGKSPALLRALDFSRRVAETNFAVFLSGESGVGKGLFAKFIHNNSQRNDKPFLTINCAAIPETMVEDEFFGHKKGAFTGADSERIGKFEVADKGTIFLDEIGDLSLDAQAKILRVLQEREFERLGRNQTIKVDIRMISATNKNIRKMVANGEFRKDLFFRLNAAPLKIPPLRNRLSDIPALAEYILSILSKEGARNDYYFHPKTLERLKQYNYCENNIRELEGIIAYAIAMAEYDPCIKPEHLYFHPSFFQGEDYFDTFITKNNLNIGQNISPLINALVQISMEMHCGKKNKAAKELGISVFLLKRYLKNPNLSSHECLQYILPDNKKNEKTADVINLPRKKPQEKQKLSKLDAKSKKIIEIAKKNGRVTNNMVRKRLKISCSAAQRLLASLVKSGILHTKGSKRGSFYTLAPQ